MKAVFVLGVLLAHRDGPDAALHRRCRCALTAERAATPGPRPAARVLRGDRPRVHADRDVADAAADHRRSATRPTGCPSSSSRCCSRAASAATSPPASTAARWRRRLRAGWCALVAVLVIFGALTTPIGSSVEGSTTPVRIAVAIALLFPPGLLMGMAFPLGMKLAAADATAPDAVALGGQRRHLGARLGAERRDRPDLVHLRRVLDRRGVLRGRDRAVRSGRAPGHGGTRMTEVTEARTGSTRRNGGNGDARRRVAGDVQAEACPVARRPAAGVQIRVVDRNRKRLEIKCRLRLRSTTRISRAKRGATGQSLRASPCLRVDLALVVLRFLRDLRSAWLLQRTDPPDLHGRIDAYIHAPELRASGGTLT